MPSSVPRAPRQLNLDLAIDDVPDVVRQHGLVETHRFPFVSMGGPLWSVRRVPTRVAWRTYPELELHSATARTVLVLDVDRTPIEYLGVALGTRIRPPNWICSNGPGGHAHIVYCLARPVLRDARQRPLTLLGRVAEYYTTAYSADQGYVGLLTHNPTHARYRDTTTWLRDESWTLDELAEPIPPHWRIPARPATIEGRNCALFKAAMRHFGRPANWDASTDLGDVLAWIERAFDEWYGSIGETAGWHRNECKWIAKSVTRYCRRNLRSGQTQRQFSFIQAARGRKSGVSRHKGSVTEAAPWEAEGVSRASWYRHQAGQHTGRRGRPPKS